MADASIELTIDGADAKFRAVSCVVDEGIDKPFVARVPCVGYIGEVPTALGGLDLIGKTATLTLRMHDGKRKYIGFVDGVLDRERQSVVRITAKIAWLADTRDYRVFVDQTAKQIVDKVLDEHQLTVDWKAERTPPQRKQCIQGFESDLAFVSRVLAEEGMCWYPKAGDGGKIIVSDVSGTFFDTRLTLPYRDEAGLEVGRSVHTAQLIQAVVTDHVVLRDYDFTHPKLDLQGEDGNGALEWYEYPGNFTSAGDGNTLAKMRLSERRAEELMLEGAILSPEIQAGGVFTLEEAPVDAQNGQWLVVSVRHEAHLRAEAGALNFGSHFRAVPAARGYRPPRDTIVRKGVTTGKITGSSGKEIMLDEYGRVRALMRWERRLPADDTASTDLRVMQAQLSGAVMNPRVGWEQLIAHSDTHAEAPVMLGRIYNGAQRPPTALPGNKVETHFGTMTTPKGSSGNFTRINDTAGKEKLLRHASKDYTEKTENDKVRKVGANEKRKIGSQRKRIIKKVRLERVDAKHSSTVKSKRSLDVHSNCWLTASSELVAVGAARLFTVGGDYVTDTPLCVRLVGAAKAEVAIEHHMITTKGSNTLIIGGSMNVMGGLSEMIGVMGGAQVKVDGAKNIKCKGMQIKVRGVCTEAFDDRTLDATGDVREEFKSLLFEMKGGGHMTGSEVIFEAESRLIIKAKGCTVTITDGNIVINGKFEGMTPSVEEGNHKYG